MFSLSVSFECYSGQGSDKTWIQNGNKDIIGTGCGCEVRGEGRCEVRGEGWEPV